MHLGALQLVRDMFGVRIMVLYNVTAALFFFASAAYLVSMFVAWPHVPSLARAALVATMLICGTISLMAVTVPLGSKGCAVNRASLVFTISSFWLEFCTDLARCGLVLPLCAHRCSGEPPRPQCACLNCSCWFIVATALIYSERQKHI